VNGVLRELNGRHQAHTCALATRTLLRRSVSNPSASTRFPQDKALHGRGQANRTCALRRRHRNGYDRCGLRCQTPADARTSGEAGGSSSCRMSHPVSNPRAELRRCNAAAAARPTPRSMGRGWLSTV
jgi:hypothetical protein